MWRCFFCICMWWDVASVKNRKLCGFTPFITRLFLKNYLLSDILLKYKSLIINCLLYFASFGSTEKRRFLAIRWYLLGFKPIQIGW